jgi:hypothetical protein
MYRTGTCVVCRNSITYSTATLPKYSVDATFRWGRRRERNKEFLTVPSTNGLISHTEDWSAVDVAVRKEQQVFDRTVKEWQTPDCFYAFPDVAFGVSIKLVIRKFLNLCGKGQRTDFIISFNHGSGVRKEVRVTDMYTVDRSFRVYI